MLRQDKKIFLDGVFWRRHRRAGFDALEFTAPITIAGVIRDGLQARISCRSDMPECDVHAQLQMYVPQLNCYAHIQRVEWRPNALHTNGGNAPAKLRFKKFHDRWYEFGLNRRLGVAGLRQTGPMIARSCRWKSRPLTNFWDFWSKCGRYRSTLILYPSGSHVVVRMDGTGDRWFVSDDGYAHLEADMMGGLSTFRRLARTLADRAGVQFDDRCFFVLEVERDALPGAVITISNVSKQAVERTAFSVEERRIAISRDVFEQRIVSAFGAKSIAHNVSIVGASGKEWDVDVGIKSDAHIERLFEFVTPDPLPLPPR